MAYTPVVVRDGNNASQSMGAFQDASSVNYSAVSLDSNVPTYRAADSFSPQVTNAVTLVTIQGSATKTIRIKRITIGGVATALSDTLVKLVRTSALGAGGTVQAATAAKMDTSSPAGTAVVQSYTTTLKAAGTPVATLSVGRMFQDTVTTPTVASREPIMLFPERGAPVGQSIVLRGTGDFLEIQNANGGSLAAGSVLDYVIEWSEDAS